MRPAALIALVLTVSTGPAVAGKPRVIELRPVTIELSAPPAVLFGADLDGDGRRDLFAISVFTSWGEVSRDRVEDAVMVTEVVPALFDRREARAWLAAEDGTFAPLPPLPLDASVHHVEAGPAGLPAVALVNGGIAVLRARAAENGPRLALETALEAPSAFDGTEAFLPSLRIVRDVDGDGEADLLFPAEDGIRVHRVVGGRLSATPTSRIRFSGASTGAPLHATRDVFLPRAEDVDGDGVLDLFAVETGSVPRVLVARGLGGGRFAPLRIVSLACLGLAGSREPPARFLSHYGDLDGDGRAEAVTRTEIDTDRGELRQAREPRWSYRFHRTRPDLSIESAPYLELELHGYATSGDLSGDDPDFRDLDGDGRKDLVTATLDFSVFQALRVVTTKRISIGVDFVVHVQRPDGTFRKVPNRGLDEKLKLDLDDLRIGRMAQFTGDFDGDGRIDFVHLGRGKTVTIKSGGVGGVYPERPDFAIDLREEPQDLALVQVRDLDGDGRADLAITRVGEAEEEGVSPPATVDLHLSGGSR